MTPLETALKILELGHVPIPVKVNAKSPYGAAWQQQRRTADQLREHYDRYPEANIGVLLGPESGLIDIEYDGAESEAVFNQLIADSLPATVSWRSNRSVHRVYKFNPLLRGCKNVVNLNARGERVSKGEPHVEGRIGGGDGCQSLLPPSVVEGDATPREYINDWSHPIADLPDSIAMLFACPAQKPEKARAQNKLGGKIRKSWNELIEAAGGKSCGDKQWTRPGKESGVSASLWKAKDGTEILHVFTSNWAPFEQGGNYNLFALYALVCHDGDFKAARKAVDPTTAHQLTTYQIETFRTAGNEAYATVPVGEHEETHKIDSQNFKLWLQNRYWNETGEPANAEAINQAVSVYKSRALFEGETKSIHVRVCAEPDAIYLDLADDQWRIVKITASGCEVLNKSPVKFRRAKGTLPLPAPDFAGQVESLRPFLNVSDDDFQLICFVLASWLYLGPYVILLIASLSGSAKTTALRFLRSIIDPNQCIARSTPKDQTDFYLAASNSFIFSLDNLSKLLEWLADALCVLSTGGGMSTREYYQQDDERIIDAMKPAMLTTIADLTTRVDFLRRCVMVRLLPITEFKTLDNLDSAFNAAHPQILGAICRASSVGLQHYQTISDRSTYCMANFARWCQAVEAGFGWPLGTFDRLYKDNRREVVDVASTNPIAQGILQLLDKQKGFDGKAKELSALLSQHCDSEEWSNSPRSLSCHLQRLVGAIPGVEIKIRPNRIIIADYRSAANVSSMNSDCIVWLFRPEPAAITRWFDAA